MPDEHDIKALAQMLRGDMDAQVKALGPQILGSSQPDAHRVDPESYHAYVRQGMFQGFPGVDPAEFRHNLIMQYGNRVALDLTVESWTGHEMEYGQAFASYQMRMAQQQMQAQQQGPPMGAPPIQPPGGVPPYPGPPPLQPPPNAGMGPGPGPGGPPQPVGAPPPMMMPPPGPPPPSMPAAVPVPMPGQGG